MVLIEGPTVARVHQMKSMAQERAYLGQQAQTSNLQYNTIYIA